MWSLNLERLKPLVRDGVLGSMAIESGTCRGNGTRVLAKEFSRVITIELSEKLFLSAKARLSGPEFSHVELRCGDSAETLANLLPQLPENQTTFFFLDAHWSGDSSVDWRDSIWKGYGVDTAHRSKSALLPSGPEQCPLAAELSEIAGKCRGPAIILVDDMKNIPEVGPGLKNHGFPGEDWSHLSRSLLMNIVEKRLASSYLLHDPEQWLLVLS
ncbi:MAG: hypothetical protein AB7K68_05700 [Bacteriovoracia bacterium]